MYLSSIVLIALSYLTNKDIDDNSTKTTISVRANNTGAKHVQQNKGEKDTNDQIAEIVVMTHINHDVVKQRPWFILLSRWNNPMA